MLRSCGTLCKIFRSVSFEIVFGKLLPALFCLDGEATLDNGEILVGGLGDEIIGRVGVVAPAEVVGRLGVVGWVVDRVGVVIDEWCDDE